MKLGPEGRVVIPASIRRHLGVGPGDNLRFVLHADGRVEIVSPQVLAEALWANNTGGDAVDSAELVRSVRSADREVSRRSESAQSHWHPAAETTDLLREMGLPE
jgi:AbrB family looped-hinge helix DNA binding protein